MQNKHGRGGQAGSGSMPLLCKRGWGSIRSHSGASRGENKFTCQLLPLSLFSWFIGQRKRKEKRRGKGVASPGRIERAAGCSKAMERAADSSPQSSGPWLSPNMDMPCLLPSFLLWPAITSQDVSLLHLTRQHSKPSQARPFLQHCSGKNRYVQVLPPATDEEISIHFHLPEQVFSFSGQ